MQHLVNQMLDRQEKNMARYTTLKSALDDLKSKISDDKKRIRITEGYDLEEAFELIKNSNFDEKEKLVVSFKGQPAVDTGGVLRQFFSNCFQQLVEPGENSDLPVIFEGNEKAKVPVCNPAIMLSGIFELCGKIMAHAIVQAGVGVAYLAPCIYEYLATGDLSKSTEMVSLKDYFNQDLKDFNKSIMEAADNQTLETIFLSDEFQNIYCETGMTELLTINNRQRIMQGLVFHFLLGKRIPALEQIRKGLNLYGVANIIQNNKEIFRPLFCNEFEMDSEKVLSKLDFSSKNVSGNSKVHSFLMNFLKSANTKRLEKFCLFCTGSIFLPLTKNIIVNYSTKGGFHASTCSFSLDVPSSYETQKDFDDGFDAVISNTASFSVV